MSEPEVELTAAQLARIERKRQNALMLRRSKVVEEGRGEAAKRAKISRVVDSAAGFLIEEEEGGEQDEEAVNLVHPAAPLEDPNALVCSNCSKDFNDSFLFRVFELRICDNCRDNDGEHRLITRSQAKEEYLLRDVDLDKREPTLKFTTRRNPHNPMWGEMRLYLERDVIARSNAVWGGEEGLTAEKERREERRFESRQRKFTKRMKELRMSVRSSLAVQGSRTHEHEFGPEEYDEDRDIYSKRCQTCDHVMEYEKL